MTRSLLVTGGAGFIGTNFVHYWIAQHPDDRVTALDALTYAGNLTNLKALEINPRFRFVHGNICDQALIARLLRAERIDTVVHFAAESHVDRSILGPDVFIKTNIVGTLSLLKAARAVWIDDRETKTPRHCFHHVSTDEVFGSLGPSDPGFCETTPYDPSSPYSASKAASDHLVRAYHRTYGLNVTISNCSNNYGPYQFPEKLVPLTILNVLNGQPIPVYGDGRNIRDWLYVGDHCLGIELILERGQPGETYNIGSQNERANIDVVRLICDILNKEFKQNATLSHRFPLSTAGQIGGAESMIEFVKDRPGHDLRYAINSGKIATTLGFEPSESFETGIHKTVVWFLNNEAWWRKVMDGSYRKWLEKQYAHR